MRSRRDDDWAKEILVKLVADPFTAEIDERPLRNDLAVRLLKSGDADAETQRDAASWIGRLMMEREALIAALRPFARKDLPGHKRGMPLCIIPALRADNFFDAADLMRRFTDD